VKEENGLEWRLTGIYGEPKSEEKQKTWRLLRILNNLYSKPWLCLGDFNEILFGCEKEGGQPRATACMEHFRKVLEDCNLEDLGFEGDAFTWRNHHHKVEGYIKERLDRAVGNVEWRSMFPLVRVVNGDPRHSDHRPIIVDCGDMESINIGCRRDVSPKFEAKWLEEEDCYERVERAWTEARETGEINMVQVQKKILGDLREWDKNVLGELEKRISQVKKELERCRRGCLNQVNVNHEHMLRYRLDRLQEQLHIYWKQRAHPLWLLKGDRNTKYFHACASDRRRRNYIKALKEEGGNVVAGKRLQSYISNHYRKLFSSCAGQNIEEVLQAVESKVSSSMNEALLKPFTGEEVEKALEGIGDLKAPGPDGVPSIFYKSFWGLVGDQVKKEVLAVLNGEPFQQGWNDSVIVLIPKVKKPVMMKDLRPISLCNVLYKLVSKVLAYRLKNILPNIISPSQSAFVPGRLITDNVLLAYEMTHYLKNKRNGKVGWAAIKLDMSKAYDRIEWSFLDKIMRKMGFADQFVDLIMKCVSTVTYRIKVNGEFSDQINPQRGLRQGDPLSPYLFILCAEGLSALFRKAEMNGEIQGIRVCPRAVSVSHLFFADDTLVLFKASNSGARSLQYILNLYEQASGQVINKDKTSIMFSPNTTQQIQQQVLSELGITQLTNNEKYLGLPVYIGKSKKKMFEYIKQKVWGRIQGWQEKLLSKAGKEIMIKAVAQAIPTYAMSCFDLTKGWCEEISSMIARYWWSQQDKTNKIHWVSWDKLTKSKCRGGLGFRDLHIFNMAMLARQAWRMLLYPNTLCAQVLQAKYFPGKTILQATPRGGISYTWRSILKGLNLLKEGIIWRIGDGKTVNIWTDPWIPRNNLRRVITPRRGSLLQKVADLINPVTGLWDEVLVRDIFWEEDANIILAMPLYEGMDDWPAWHPDPKGFFSVKSAYALGTRVRDNLNCVDASTSISMPTSFEWKKIWRMNVANKVKVFVWQLAHNSLQVKQNIARRGIKLDTVCPMCHRFDEDAGHLFLKCKNIRLCWLLLNLEEERLSLVSLNSGTDLLDKIWTFPEDVQQKIILLLWCWWTARNKTDNGERRKSSQEVVSDVSFHMNAWNLAHNFKKQTKREPVKQNWKAPPEDYYKINCDGAFFSKTCKGGWGFIIRNHLGQVVVAAAGSADHLMNAQHAEAMACLKGLEQAAVMGLQHVILETDASVVANGIGGNCIDRSVLSTLFREIRANVLYDFATCSISRCPRECNLVAHSLADMGVSCNTGPMIWMDQVPDNVAALVSSDLRGHCV
jgi:ribonuclease HI